MMLSILTFIHLAFALIAISSGAIVLFGLLTRELLDKWAVLYLRCSLAASVTGFAFPFDHLPLTHKVSMLSVYVAGAVILAWRKYHLAGVWRPIFAMTTTAVLYLNVFVATTEVFKDEPPFTALAPTPSEPTFLVAQFLVLVLFVVLGIIAGKRFHNPPTYLL